MAEMVMVIEDEKEIRDLLQYNLERAGWKVATFDDGEKGLEQIFASRPDAVILDLMLPGKNGLEILREVRGEPATSDLPVLVLTARGAEMDKLLGFELGADDYLTKPFAFAELLARIQALIRRSGTEQSPRLAVADLEVDPVAHRVWRAGRELTLTNKEYALLEYLLRNPDRVLTRTAIIEHVWDIHYDGMTNIVDVHIRALRAKVDREFSTPLIHTVRGVGYVLKTPEA